MRFTSSQYTLTSTERNGRLHALSGCRHQVAEITRPPGTVFFLLGQTCGTVHFGFDTHLSLVNEHEALIEKGAVQ
jgi:hypothetical protein